MADKRELDWDGETIVEKIEVEPIKINPKKMLDVLNQVRSDIDKMQGELVKLENNKETTKKNLQSAKEFLQTREKFEKKCIELQVEKLKLYINQIKDGCLKDSVEYTEEQLKKDPNSMTEQQKSNLLYIQYQRRLATNPKIAANISQHIIKSHLFEEPIFENPFVKD